MRLLLLLACLLPTASHAVTLVQDGFETDTHPTGVRTVSTAPGSPFYTRAVTGGTTLGIVSDTGFGPNPTNVLAFTDTTSDSQSEGFIGSIGTTVNLTNVNDYLRLDFKFRYTNNGSANNAAAFRFGLFSSAGTPVTADNQAESVDNTGYYVQVGSGTTAPATDNVFFEENGGTAPILGGTDRANRVSSAVGFTINDNTVHTASFIITRSSATAMSLSISIDGATPILASDSVSPIRTQFDEFAFGNGFSTTGLNFMLDDILITSNVPEPKIAGLLTLALAAWSLQRRRARSS